MTLDYVNLAKNHGRLLLDLEREPCPTILANGIYGGSRSQYYLEDDGVKYKHLLRAIFDTRGNAGVFEFIDGPAPCIMSSPRNSTHYKLEYIMRDTPEDVTVDPSKPAYRVPSMKEIEAMPRNGLKVASTFSGAGGSCLGYRMAGFSVVWANEFVPIAQDSYRANHPTSVLDPRDIKEVKPEDILRATGLAKGELDIFDGSPPCQAFSTAGKRDKNWGKEKHYEHGATQKNETLFDEYIRLLRGLMPRAFIAENVSGLIKGSAKGYFIEIMKALKDCGYRVEAKLLDAKWLGVPQNRQRIIFQGVREDLGKAPCFPGPLPYFYTVREAITGLDSEAFPIVGNEVIIGNEAFKPRWGDPGKFSSPTIMAGGASGSSGLVREKETAIKRKFTIPEVKRICSFPDDFILCGKYDQQWERLGNSVPPVMMSKIAAAIRDGVLT